MIAGKILLDMLKKMKDNPKCIPEDNREFIENFDYSKLVMGRCTTSEIVRIMSSYKNRDKDVKPLKKRKTPKGS